MTIKDIIALTVKGINLDQMKTIKASEDASGLIELIKSGMNYDQAIEAIKLADSEQDNEQPASPAVPEPAKEDEQDDWKEKYNDLLQKTQLEKQRENNKNGDEEAEAQKHLEDAVRSFM